MEEETELASSNKSWVVSAVGITLVLFAVSALLGFIILPAAEGNESESLWASICRAAGLPVSSTVNTEGVQGTKVAIANAVPSIPPGESIGRGATLAQQCAICHGPTGVSRADAPNLAGQYATVTYKQLRDFKDQVRVSAVMSPFAEHLTEENIQDLAAYYASLQRIELKTAKPDVDAPTIVASGAPLRGIAPCGSCHGAIENKLGSPWLEGQSVVYLRNQLNAFAQGSRHNDLNEQMRNVARAMTAAEIEAAAQYYASKPQPPEI